MISFPARVPAVVSLAVALVAGAYAAEPAIIAKARAFVGTEDAINAVKSVHYTGTVTSADPTDPSRQTRASIEIIAQKPDQQRVVAQSEKATETTVLDGYEGWQRTDDATNPKNVRLVVFRPDAVKRLRAQAWENVAFFRGIDRLGGHYEEQGTEKIDGLTCQKVAFIYSPNVIFYRYFDVATGRLVQTDTEDGGSTREEGEQIVNGVRFPTRMKMTIKGPNGQTKLVTIALEKVTVNETFPPELFRMPSPRAE